MPGVWGPYFDAMVDGACGSMKAANPPLGQPSTALLSLHPRPMARQRGGQAERANRCPPICRAERRSRCRVGFQGRRDGEGLHVVPEFLGNRAPFADPHARAVIAGLGMEQDPRVVLSRFTSPGMCGIGYGLRQIIETSGRAMVRRCERIVISGGAGQDDLVRQIVGR